MRKILFVGLLLSGFVVCCQTTTHSYNNVWFRLFLNNKITEKLKWELFLQDRRQAFSNRYNLTEKQQLQSYWLWLHYTLPNNFLVSVSPVCYFNAVPVYNLNSSPNWEWRWTAKVDHQKKFGRLQMINRLSAEYRYRYSSARQSYSVNYRARYFLRFAATLAQFKDKPVQLVFFNEIFYQMNNDPSNLLIVFDQNRSYLGLNCQPAKNFRLELGYCNVYGQRATRNDIDIQNALWLTLTFENFFSLFKREQNTKP